MQKHVSIEKSKVSQDLFVAEDSSQIALSGAVPYDAQVQLARMFRDPYILEKQERTDLIQTLQRAVEESPRIAELRILLGMALCIDLQIQDAMEVLRAAVTIDPDSFLARLKLGELLMRLRVCDRAVEETRAAALLASNPIQSELARRQAAALRTMMREGIERGGYQGPLKFVTGMWQRFARSQRSCATSLASRG